MRRALRPLRLSLLTLALFGLTVAPLYLLWLTPEMFNLGLIAVGPGRLPQPARAGRGPLRRRDLLEALQPVRGPAPGRRPSCPGFGAGRKRFLAARSASRCGGGPCSSARPALLFALNFAVTGEVNYQGGERKTFYGLFPFEARPDGTKVTFGNSGIWMTTDHLGPARGGPRRGEGVAAHGAAAAARGDARILLRNLGYFWVGRFGGVVGYFLPALVAVVAFPSPRARAPRAAGWPWPPSAVSWIFYIWMIPDNWYGGGGHGGQPLLPEPAAAGRVPVVPAGAREWPVAAAGVVCAPGSLFLAPFSSRPLRTRSTPASTPRAEPFGGFLPSSPC